MKHSRIDGTSGVSIGVYVLFLGSFLALVLFGARAYGNVTKSQSESENRRALLSYVTFSVRNHDHEGAVSVSEGPEGDALVLTDTYGTRSYSTSIYVRDGTLVQEFGKAGGELGTGEIQTIGDCGSLLIERVSDSCLRVSLDGAGVLLHLRSGSEGAA